MNDGRIDVLYERFKQIGVFEKIIQLDDLEFCQILLNTSMAQYVPIVAASIHHLIQFENIFDLCRGPSLTSSCQILLGTLLSHTPIFQKANTGSIIVGIDW